MEMKAFRLLVVVFSGMLSTVCSQASAEPWSGQLRQAFFVPGGQYVVATYTGGNLLMWDLKRLYVPHQPVVVAAFSAANSRFNNTPFPVAVSGDGKRLIFGDKDRKSLRLASIEDGLPVRRTIPLETEDCAAVSLNDDASRLVYVANKQIHHVQFGSDGTAPSVTKQPLENVSALEVDWSRNKALVGHSNGTVRLVELPSMEVTQTFQPAKSRIRRLCFSPDGSHAFVGTYDGGRRTQRLSLSAVESDREDVANGGLLNRIELVERESERATVAIRRMDSRWHQILPVSTSGDIIGDRVVREDVYVDGIIRDISLEANCVLLETDLETLSLYDLRSGLQMFYLSLDRNHLSHNGQQLPHLRPRLGVWPRYVELHRSIKGATKLIRFARFLEVLNDRYDPVWFSLSTSRDSALEKITPETWMDLEQLCECLHRLHLAERLMETQPESVTQLMESQFHRVQDVRTAQDDPSQQREAMDELGQVIHDYWSVVHRDTSLLLGQSLLKQNEWNEAAPVFLQILKEHPYEWRAYEGMLLSSFRLPDDRFDALLNQCQEQLQYQWLTRGVGLPVKFFAEDGVYQIRESVREVARPQDDLDPEGEDHGGNR